MQPEINKIMCIMDTIEYGFKDEFGKNIINSDPKKWNEEFASFYFLQTKEELLQSKCGICWDQVELERNLFKERKIKFNTYFIYIKDVKLLPSHTFLTYEFDHKHYWFEHSWGLYKGIHEYDSELELLLDIKRLFLMEHNYVGKNSSIFIYEYETPKSHLTCEEFYNYIETQKIVKINKPLYFYHLVNKNVDMTNGLISLQYMYDHRLFELFDKNILKYKKRIINDWNIEKYNGKLKLTREEYIDALNCFRGDQGSNYIYFFKFPPYKRLGHKIEELSKYKDIYRININDEEVQKYIIDIFYGFDMSNSDNKKLDKNYYENVSVDEYFSNYDDNIKMNFSKLNHIGISFKKGNCPLELLEKIDWN